MTALAAVALLLFGAGPVFAGGTPSGTTISNTATLDYSVGTVPQTQVPSNAVTFKVDKKVDLTVTSQDSTIVTVAPGATAQVLTFTVTNTGNDTQDIDLQAIAEGNGTSNPFGSGSDDFDGTNGGVYVESGATAGYQSGQDTATYIDELAPDASKTVYIVRDIPAAQADGDIAVYALLAQVRAGGTANTEGGTLTQTAAASVSDNTVDTLFADGAGSDDSANDAQFSVRDAFEVVTATMSVTKTQAISGGYAVPGATVTYTITVTNNGSADATSATISDVVPTNTAYTTGTLTCPTGATAEYSTDNGSTFSATEPASGTTNVECSGATVSHASGSNTATMSFAVTIN